MHSAFTSPFASASNFQSMILKSRIVTQRIGDEFILRVWRALVARRFNKLVVVTFTIACFFVSNRRLLSDDFQSQVQPLLTTYCTACHRGSDAEGEIDFSEIRTDDQVKASFEIWESVVTHLKAQTMPPEDESQPSALERNRVYRWYREFVAGIQARPADYRPRRLSVVEYRNTLRSVLGFDLEVAIMEAEQTVSEKSLVIKLMPIDPPGESGFKNDTHGNPLTVVSWDQHSFLVDSALEELFAKERQTELAALTGVANGVEKNLESSAVELGESQLEQLFRTVLTRAYRRTVDESELSDVLTRLEGKQHQQLVAGIKQEIKTVLMSARFLYRGIALNGKPGRQPVDQFELAERLSYFLWADMPDDRLMSLASEGKLATDATYTAEIDRMLDSNKARSISDVFASEWLTLNEIDLVGNNPPIVASLKSQPLDFLNYLFTENRPLLELIDSEVAFINPHTSKMYGTDSKQMVKYVKQRGIEIENVPNQKVRLKATKERGGILTMPGVLAMNQGPILRGTWILERILGEHLPEPPMNISPVGPNKRGEKLTFRERFEQHRANPACAICHDRIDPIGFSLDMYGAGGQYLVGFSSTKKAKKKNRTEPINLERIDTSGRLPSGEVFKDIDELKEILISSQRRVVIRNIVERTMSYALCRRLEYFDRPIVEQIVQKMDEENGTWRDLFHAIAGSIAFRETVIPGK